MYHHLPGVVLSRDALGGWIQRCRRSARAGRRTRPANPDRHSDRSHSSETVLLTSTHTAIGVVASPAGRRASLTLTCPKGLRLRHDPVLTDSESSLHPIAHAFMLINMYGYNAMLIGSRSVCVISHHALWAAVRPVSCHEAACSARLSHLYFFWYGDTSTQKVRIHSSPTAERPCGT